MKLNKYDEKKQLIFAKRISTRENEIEHVHSKQSWPTPYKLSPLVATGLQDRQLGHKMVCL